MKCIEDEIPFELPEGWAWCRVQTIASVKGGKRVPKGYAVTDEKTNHIYIRVTDMKNSTIMLDDLKYISDEVYSQILNYVISKDDIYVTIAGTIGNVGEVPDELDGMNLTENAAKVCNISIDKSFLCKVLSSEFVQKQFRFQTHQVTMAKLALERILDTLIPIAPIDEQTKISRIIDDLSAKIYEIQNSNNNLQALISATKFKILDLAIRGKLVPQDPNDEPSSVLLERIRAEKEELIKQGKIKRDKKESVIFKGDDNSYYEKISNDVTCIDDEISFDIPDTWSWTRISTITDITMGSSPKSQDICNDNQYIEFHQGKIYFSKKTLMKSNQYTRKTTKLAPKQSVLLCVRAPVGELNITDRDICIGRGLASIKSLGNINEEFIFYWLHPYKTYLVNQSTGSTFSAITSDTVRNILIPLPPLMEQKEILNKIQKVFTLLENLETVN